MTDSEDEDGLTDEQIEEIIEDTIEMDGAFSDVPPDGQECEREGCNKDAVRGPGDEWLCREHQNEFFRKRHG